MEKQEAKKTVPLNQKLWDALVVQARAKFNKWPSLPASKWAHQQYVQRGGRFASAAEISSTRTAVEKHNASVEAKKKEKDEK